MYSICKIPVAPNNTVFSQQSLSVCYNLSVSLIRGTVLTKSSKRSKEMARLVFQELGWSCMQRSDNGVMHTCD